jgi:hypothetical protein
MTVKVLRQHCAEFDLRQTGSKTMLIERLEEFSHDPDSWDRCAAALLHYGDWELTSCSRLRPGAHKSHKGPRANQPTDMARPGRTKQSTQRRAQLVGATAATAVIDRSKDTRTSAEVAALLPWVSHSFFLSFLPSSFIEMTDLWLDRLR